MVTYGLTRVAVVWCFIPALLGQPPGIGQNGVVNTASQIPPTLPGGAIARGASFNIYGVRLTSAAGTTITLTRPGLTLPVKIKGRQSKKLEALMPPSAPLGQSSLVVTVDGRASKPFPVEVAAMNPGIYTRNREGWGPGSIENISGSGNISENSIANPARPGQRVAMTVTGMGAANTAVVMVGNRIAQGTVTTKAEGEERITFEIPRNAPTGCWVPLYLNAAANRASNVVTISIRSGPGYCDPGLFPLYSSKRLLLVTLSRSRTRSSQAGQPDVVSEEARVAARSPAPESVPPRHGLLPPAGTCNTFTGSAQFDVDLMDSFRGLPLSKAAGLDAGDALQLRRNSPKPESRELGAVAGNYGTYRAYLGLSGMNVRGRLPGLFLDPGLYHLEGHAGSKVGPIRMDFSITAPAEWTDIDEKSVVNRASGVTVHWKNAADQQLILIVARVLDPLTTASALCVCAARPNAGQFTIPPTLLGNFPASVIVPNRRFDDLGFASISVRESPKPPADGLDGGFVFTVYDTRRVVDFR